VDAGSYRRTISLQGNRGTIEVRLGRTLELSIDFPDVRALILIVDRVRRLFDLRADPSEILAQLTRDPLLAGFRPGLRVPGAWDGFELAVRAILGQQVSVKGATTLAGRLVRAFGEPVDGGDGLTHLFPTPDTLAAADYSSIGLPAARAEAIRQLASAVARGELNFSGAVEPAHFIERFKKLPGIGEWTAQYVAMRALGDPDAFPAADLGLLRATGLTNPKQLEVRAERWRPWRAYAAMHLWQENAHDKLHVHGKPRRAVAAGGR
jgi:3-methyladenine DNA glycosylase/8-oxoguanine DNA glycosylase